MPGPRYFAGLGAVTGLAGTGDGEHDPVLAAVARRMYARHSRPPADVYRTMAIVFVSAKMDRGVPRAPVDVEVSAIGPATWVEAWFTPRWRTGRRVICGGATAERRPAE